MKQLSTPGSPAIVNQRKNQIIEAAISVLLEKGINATSMNDIIRASGFSKGGVYHHFNSKEVLLVGVLDYFFEQYCSDMVTPAPSFESAVEQLRQMVSGHQDMLIKLGEYNTLMMDFFTQATHIKLIMEKFQQQYSLFQTAIAELIRLGIDNGEFRGNTNAEAIASGIIGVFDGTGLALMIAPDNVAFPDCAVLTALAIIDGIKRQDSFKPSKN